MIERVTELHGRVQSARTALEGLAERAAQLRARLQEGPVAREAPPPMVMPPPAPPVPPEETSALASSLERLTQTPWVPVTTGAPEGDDGRFVSDAWEIALISEEGK